MAKERTTGRLERKRVARVDAAVAAIDQEQELNAQAHAEALKAVVAAFDGQSPVSGSMIDVAFYREFVDAVAQANNQVFGNSTITRTDGDALATGAEATTKDNWGTQVRASSNHHAEIIMGAKQAGESGALSPITLQRNETQIILTTGPDTAKVHLIYDPQARTVTRKTVTETQTLHVGVNGLTEKVAHTPHHEEVSHPQGRRGRRSPQATRR